MKTTLPLTLTTPDECNAFLRELYENDEFYHIDDDPHDIIHNPSGEWLFTKEEADSMQALITQGFAVCNMWELPIIRLVLDNIKKESA